jgi:hypothetical protein
MLFLGPRGRKSILLSSGGFQVKARCTRSRPLDGFWLVSLYMISENWDSLVDAVIISRSV